VITPRTTRLLRAHDLRALQRTIVSVLPPGLARRSVAVIVPTRSAAEQLRRTIENLVFAEGAEGAVVLPDLLTREEWYLRLHERLPEAPPLVTEFEREVLLRLAAEDAAGGGAPAPFRLRPGLLSAILGFYDDLRRRGRTIDSLDANVASPLEAGVETDRGAARLLRQTQFLSATFAAFERRVADSGRIDEHGLRALLLSSEVPGTYRHVLVTVPDQAADARGLWPADFDLLSRMPGVERLDVIATERLLASGWHQRVHDALPGLEEQRVPDVSPPPALLAPTVAPGSEPRSTFVSRDREEELVDAARWIKERARMAVPRVPALDRTAVVFQRPLPYLYLARQVFGSSSIPYQTLDALPLAAEPFAAALDLVFVVASEEATRTAIVELAASPHWKIADPTAPGRLLTREQVAALDRVLQESKYLGGWDRLDELAARAAQRTEGGRDAARWQRAAPALAAVAALGPALEPLHAGATASVQLEALLSFVRRFERFPDRNEPFYERHMRARTAIFGALMSLAQAHAMFDDRRLPIVELVATLRRWIEGQTFAPRDGREGVLLLDARAAAFADVDAVRLVGLVESDWPERTTASIFYPASLLRAVGWPPESERLAASRAQFQDLLLLGTNEISLSSFTLEDDAIVPASSFLEDIGGSGLVIHRASPDADARIFTHEALTAPVAAAAIASTAAEWLDLRRNRTSAADPRYRGDVGPRPIDVHAVSRVERFLECPFKYFAGQVLQLDEEREDESGLTPIERGQLLHDVFESFFESWRAKGHRRMTAANLGDAIALFAEVAEAALQALPEGDRALERTYLLGSAASPGLAERAFVFEIEHGVEVIERLLEHPLEGSFTFEGADGPRRLRVRGKADRIDLLADSTLRVVDYKLGRAPKPGRALQLPVYGVCAVQQLEGRHGRSWSLGRAGYVAFKEKNAFVDLRGKTGNLETALRDGQVRFVEAVGRIEAGEFPVSPDEPWLCTRCGFSHVCRKDYVGDE
jgi:inactivated superfamily I helicase